ncbi:nuclear transport factor 2 family protein [Streptomyces sp. NPDC057253]|uniref:nuclear transport factor 2 family protein n=1 Tax=Streptomyces sp. NPDC057253 TaxID=3346069 RepID=UPI003640AE96
MDSSTYDAYIRRFNAEDDTAFDDYLDPDMRMLNGTLEFRGVQGMKDHYAKIWGRFRETLHVERFVSDGETVAVRMHTHFEALGDHADSLFGPVRKGESFDYRGIIMYEIKDGRFATIQVSYNSFTATDLEGRTTQMGIPH